MWSRRKVTPENISFYILYIFFIFAILALPNTGFSYDFSVSCYIFVQCYADPVMFDLCYLLGCL